jgi:hypothetical protein
LLYITQWRLGTNIEYRSLAHLFGVGLSTVCVVVHEVAASIISALMERYVRIPTGDAANMVVDGSMHTHNVLELLMALISIGLRGPVDMPERYERLCILKMTDDISRARADVAVDPDH